MAATSPSVAASRASSPARVTSRASLVSRLSVATRRVATSAPARTMPVVTFELPMSMTSSMGGMIRGAPGYPRP